MAPTFIERVAREYQSQDGRQPFRDWLIKPKDSKNTIWLITKPEKSEASPQKGATMALTREFKDTVMQLCNSADYRKELLLEALESYLDGDIGIGNSLLRDYLNGTQAFADVAREMALQEASLRRMVGPKGNATAKNLFSLFRICLLQEGIRSADEFLNQAA